jgi:hypothetical protein
MSIFCSYRNPAQKDTVNVIFEELKQNHCISFDRELKPQIGISNFGSSISNNVILYDPKLSNLSKETIRFFLLHEEGHFIKGYAGYYLNLTVKIFGIIIAVIAIAATISALIFNIAISLSGWLFIIALCCFSGFLITFSTSLSAKSLEWGEFLSDEYAAKKLQEKYSIQKPSESLIVAFNEFEKFYEINFKSNHGFVRKIWNAKDEYYPTNPQRVDYVKYYIDSK